MTMSRFKGAPQKPPTPQSTTQRPRILYVEDDDVVWEVAELALRNEYQLTRAKNAKEAFEVLSKETFETILMDIYLSNSDLDGIQITQVLKGRALAAPAYAAGITTPNTPIIFVTAYTARYSEKELLDAGGDDCIWKPIDFIGLSLAISRVRVRRLMGMTPGQTFAK